MVQFFNNQLQLGVLPLSQNPQKKAMAYKDEGNKHFKSGKYAEAIKFYDSAIEICPKDSKLDLSTFYQNRAAAYEQMVGMKSH